MPLEKVSLTRDQAFSMQSELIEAFSRPDFQRKLLQRWKAAGEDMVLQAKARQEVCLEVQGPIIAKYGFEASRKGVAMSVLAFQVPELANDHEIRERNNLLGRLADPSKRGEQIKTVTRRSGRDMQGVVRQRGMKLKNQREAQAGFEGLEPGGEQDGAEPGAPTVDIAVDANCYEGLEVPAGCTVGLWKRLVREGLLGKPVMYAERLTCHLDGAGKKEPALADDAALPEPPDRMNVKGPLSILNMLELGLKTLQKPERKPQIGRFRMGKEIGSGINGVCVYKAESVQDGSEAALKWPAKDEEVQALREIDRRAPIGCLGIPHLLASGTYREKPYIVTELLGKRLSTAFPCSWSHPLEVRWRAICVMGRMLVRRLENLHRCGYVHCDISPENVLLGPGGLAAADGTEDHREALCLVDFGLARRFPNGGPLAGEFGSAEWSSVASADGGERRPEDDMEALGWVLLNGLFGSLPWLGILGSAYATWSDEETRWSTIRLVQRLKRQLLEFIGTGRVTQSSWELAGLDWQRFAETPRELYQFIRICQSGARPDYLTLQALLGSTGELTPWAAEQEDRKQWTNYVVPLM